MNHAHRPGVETHCDHCQSVFVPPLYCLHQGFVSHAPCAGIDPRLIEHLHGDTEHGLATLRPANGPIT